MSRPEDRERTLHGPRPALSRRSCGTCQLCCRLLPVKELAKPANARCRHQHAHKGCAIYRQRPRSCRLWSCSWLVDEDTAALSRPDRAHYVIDVVPDFITVEPEDGSAPSRIPVVQVWLDPAYPDAHRDPALRAYLASKGEHGHAALIRRSSDIAFVLWPPALVKERIWFESESAICGVEHSWGEIMGSNRIRAQGGAPAMPRGSPAPETRGGGAEAKPASGAPKPQAPSAPSGTCPTEETS